MMKLRGRLIVVLLLVGFVGAASLAFKAVVAQPVLSNQDLVFPGDLAVLGAVEQIALSNDWRDHIRLAVPRGGHAVAIIGVGNDSVCKDLKISAPDARVYVVLPTLLTSPSSVGTPVGAYYDILAPQNPVTCRLSPFRLIEWIPQRDGPVMIAAGVRTVSIDVSIVGQYFESSKPFFVGLSNAFLFKGHCLKYCPREAEFARKYGDLLRDHHVTPIQSWITVPPMRDGRLDLDHGRKNGKSFRQTGGGTSQSFVNFPRMTLYSNQRAYLRALERTVREDGLAGRAWVYVRDEPVDLEALKNELALYRQFAPSVMTMVTMPYRDGLADLIDIYAPNIAEWQPRDPGYAGKVVWPYASCMGSCGPNRAYKEDSERTPGPDVERPDFLIDRPVRHINEFFSMLARTGADGGLYYHAVEGHALYRKGIDVVTDPWNFGGNGDGVLVYPGRPGELGLTEHTALPSFRLKLIRQAIERHWLE